MKNTTENLVFLMDTVSELDRRIDNDFKPEEFDDERLLIAYAQLYYSEFNLIATITDYGRAAEFLLFPFWDRTKLFYSCFQAKEATRALIFWALLRSRSRTEIRARIYQHGMSRATVAYLLYQDELSIRDMFFAMHNTLKAWGGGNNWLLFKALRTPYAASIGHEVDWLGNRYFSKLNSVWEMQHDVIAIVHRKAKLTQHTPNDAPVIFRLILAMVWWWLPAMKGDFDDIQFKVFNILKYRYERAEAEREAKFINYQKAEELAASIKPGSALEDSDTQFEMWTPNSQALTFESFSAIRIGIADEEEHDFAAAEVILDWIKANYKGPFYAKLLRAIWAWCFDNCTQAEAAQKADMKLKTFENILLKLPVTRKIKKVC